MTTVFRFDDTAMKAGNRSVLPARFLDLRHGGRLCAHRVHRGPASRLLAAGHPDPGAELTAPELGGWGPPTGPHQAQEPSMGDLDDEDNIYNLHDAWASQLQLTSDESAVTTVYRSGLPPAYRYAAEFRQRYRGVML